MEDRLIHANDVLRFADNAKARWGHHRYLTWDGLIYLISKLSTIKSEPAQHGRWEPTDYDAHRCTNCGGKEDYWWADKGTPYCPWCGARMDLEE